MRISFGISILSLLLVTLLILGCNNNEKPVIDPPQKRQCKTFVSGGREKIELKSCYMPNELISNTSNFETPELDLLEDYLTAQGFQKVDSCFCEQKLNLWRWKDPAGPAPDLIGVVEGAPKRGSGVWDSTGLALNYELEIDSNFKGREQQLDSPQGPFDTIVKVGLLDSGIDDQHPLLGGFLNGAADRVCHSSHIMDTPAGLNVASPDTPQPIDLFGHGTHLAGILTGLSRPAVAASSDVGIELIAAKITEGQSGSLRLFDAVCGMYYALEEGARVLNLSWGYMDTLPPEIMIPFIERANAEQVVLVAGAGNGSVQMNGKEKFWPAGFSSHSFPDGRATLISVGAYDPNNGELAGFSNWGKPVDISADGVDILSTYLHNSGGAAISSGTSMATGYVSRTAAILIGLNPTVKSEQVKNCILSSTDKVDSGKAPPLHKVLLLNHRNAVLSCEALSGE